MKWFASDYPPLPGERSRDARHGGSARKRENCLQINALFDIVRSVPRDGLCR
jgi:hypothetical protein